MRRLIVPVLAIPLAVGCQSYKPMPLEDSSVLSAWRERSVSLPLVSEFAAEQSRLNGNNVTFNAADGLNLAESESVALLFNPSLRAARLAAGVARVGSAEAGRWQDPSIGVDAQRIISGADDPWVVGGLVNLTIPLSGRLAVEKRLALAQADVEELKVLQEERRVLAELRKTWADWSAAMLKTRVIEQAIADLGAISRSAGHLSAAGEIDPTDARLFQIDLVRWEGQLIATRRQAAALEADLRGLMGLAPSAPLGLLPDLSVEPNTSPLPAEKHISVQVTRAEYAVAEKALELEIRRQYPDLDLGGGFGTDEGDSRILGSFSIPLPVLNGNRRGIAEAAASREAARAGFEQTLMAADSAIARAGQDILSAMQELELIETRLVPLVDRQLLEARRLLEVGEFNPLVVREAIDSATEAKLDLLAARASVAAALANEKYWTETALPVATIKEKP